jgi:succinylarginine dihydrolase
MREVELDGIPGPTHNFGGLSPGNLASTGHGGQASNPRAAALQGLAKMRFVRSLGVTQGVLPPHPRPRLSTLRALGFRGSDEQVLAAAAQGDGLLLRQASSAAAMWTANAATVVPSADARDGRAHFVPANLAQMFHRAIEADTTRDVLRAIFADDRRFVVHDPLPTGSHFADEGAANHTRLVTDGHAAVHLFAWGRRAWGEGPAPTRFPARQTLEASQALARLGDVDPARALFPQQHPAGIDAGGFHTDVLAVGNERVLLVHELAFLDLDALVARLRALCGPSLRVVVATNDELPVADAVGAYPYNSELLTLPDGSMVIVAPKDSEETPRARAFLDRVVAEDNPVAAVHYVDLRQSMNNGGGPACLRLRVPLEDAELAALGARVIVDDALDAELAAWIERSYRDRLEAKDLADPALAREAMTALDELTRILRLGSVYDFQR